MDDEQGNLFTFSDEDQDRELFELCQEEVAFKRTPRNAVWPLFTLLKGLCLPQTYGGEHWSRNQIAAWLLSRSDQEHIFSRSRIREAYFSRFKGTFDVEADERRPCPWNAELSRPPERVCVHCRDEGTIIKDGIVVACICAVGKEVTAELLAVANHPRDPKGHRRKR